MEIILMHCFIFEKIILKIFLIDLNFLNRNLTIIKTGYLFDLSPLHFLFSLK